MTMQWPMKSRIKLPVSIDYSLKSDVIRDQ